MAFKQHDTTSAFQAFAVAPGPNRSAFKHLRRFVTLNGDHTWGKYLMTLLAATMLDANNNIVLMAFALFPIKNKEWWAWFLSFLSDAFNVSGINDADKPIVFIPDADKKLKAALEDVFPSSYHDGMYVWHLSENVRTKHGCAQAAAFVFPLAKAKTELAYETIKAQLCLVPGGPKAIEYLNKQDINQWARHAFPLSRFGHTTFNIVESLNSVLREIRGLPPLLMVEKIWHYIMTTRYTRKSYKYHGFLPNATMTFCERLLKKGSQFTLHQSNDHK